MKCPNCDGPLYKFVTVFVNTESGRAEPLKRFPHARDEDPLELMCPRCRDRHTSWEFYYDEDEETLSSTDGEKTYPASGEKHFDLARDADE